LRSTPSAEDVEMQEQIDTSSKIKKKFPRRKSMRRKSRNRKILKKKKRRRRIQSGRVRKNPLLRVNKRGRTRRPDFFKYHHHLRRKKRLLSTAVLEVKRRNLSKGFNLRW